MAIREANMSASREGPAPKLVLLSFHAEGFPEDDHDAERSRTANVSGGGS